MNYTDRVEGLQICDPTYICIQPKDTPPQYDIVKWQQHKPIKVVDFANGWNTFKDSSMMNRR